MITACSSNAYIQKVTPVTSNISSYDTASISVEGISESVKRKHGYTNVKEALEKDFIRALSQTAKFKHVDKWNSSHTASATIHIELKIEYFEYLSGAASVMGGILSGNSSIKVIARLIDAKSGGIIGELRSGAHTKSSGGVFRGSTGTLITEVSNKLANEISSYM